MTVKKLIKNGDIILDGTGARYEKEKEAFNKLSRLEDIEEELGIDLITLFKALKNGVYMSTKHFDIVYCKCPKIIHYKSGWKILVYGATLSLTTYGKTWALTKEELQ